MPAYFTFIEKWKHRRNEIENNNKKEQHIKCASQTILRKHINELKRQNDFNNFLAKTNIGVIDEINSISDSEWSSSWNNGKRWVMRNESCQATRNNNIKKFDINKAFVLLSPQQVIKNGSPIGFFKSVGSETNTRDKKSSEENIQSVDYSQDIASNKNYAYATSKVIHGRERSYSNNEEPRRASREFSFLNLNAYGQKSSRAFTPN